LRQKGEAALGQWLDRQVGAETDVFVERAGGSSCVGRTAQFAEAVLTGAERHADTGATVRARVSGHDGRRLMAEALA
jgi:tRNA A37 methylthiotransferase MiaB